MSGANEAVCPPWYWKSAAAWPEPFHEEIGGDYVKETLGCPLKFRTCLQKPQNHPDSKLQSLPILLASIFEHVFCMRQEIMGQLRMGTKILQKRLPDWKVVRCERIEDALLWEKYTAKRAQSLGLSDFFFALWRCMFAFQTVGFHELLFAFCASLISLPFGISKCLF